MSGAKNRPIFHFSDPKNVKWLFEGLFVTLSLVVQFVRWCSVPDWGALSIDDVFLAKFTLQIARIFVQEIELSAKNGPNGIFTTPCFEIWINKCATPFTIISCRVANRNRVFRFVFLLRSDKSIFTTANLRYLRFKNPNLFDFTQNNIFCKSLKTNKIKLKPKAMIYVFVVFVEFAIFYSKSIIYNCHKIRLLAI